MTLVWMLLTEARLCGKHRFQKKGNERAETQACSQRLPAAASGCTAVVGMESGRHVVRVVFTRPAGSQLMRESWSRAERSRAEPSRPARRLAPKAGRAEPRQTRSMVAVPHPDSGLIRVPAATGGLAVAVFIRSPGPGRVGQELGGDAQATPCRGRRARRARAPSRWPYGRLAPPSAATALTEQPAIRCGEAPEKEQLNKPRSSPATGLRAAGHC